MRTILGTTYRSKLGRIIFVHSLEPCPWKGASLGEEAVLAGSGRAGEIAARVGRVRSLSFLSILLGSSLMLSAVHQPVRK